MRRKICHNYGDEGERYDVLLWNAMQTCLGGKERSHERLYVAALADNNMKRDTACI